MITWPLTQSSPGPLQSWLRKGILASAVGPPAPAPASPTFVPLPSSLFPCLLHCPPASFTVPSHLPAPVSPSLILLGLSLRT